MKGLLWNAFLFTLGCCGFVMGSLLAFKLMGS